MRLLKAILAVVVMCVVLVIPDNGKNGDTVGGDESKAGPPVGAVREADTSSGYNPASSPRTWPPVGVAVSCTVLVYSTPEEVWDALTTVRRFFMWYPHWEREKNMMRRLAAVGDTVAFHRGGARVGRSVVTSIEPLKELTIVHELEDGGWAGSMSITLSRSDRGVELVYEELLPPSGATIEDEKRRVCRQANLIKRLAEGE